MKGDYGSLAWVNDREGREFFCTVDAEHSDEKEFENLSDTERKSCSNVNEIIEAGG
jgi:hypothetical protein